MIVNFHHRFRKEFQKLPAKLQAQARLELFARSPYDRLLHNHSLVGRYGGYRSININADVRAVYKVNGSESVTFVRIGTHSQLYK
jgi:addiction module RelE/StbE family toxin